MDFETAAYLGIVGRVAREALAKAGQVGISKTLRYGHYFGPQYDLHGGGMDLKFPHHEAKSPNRKLLGLLQFVNTGCMSVS